MSQLYSNIYILIRGACGEAVIHRASHFLESFLKEASPSRSDFMLFQLLQRTVKTTLNCQACAFQAGSHLLDQQILSEECLHILLPAILQISSCAKEAVLSGSAVFSCCLEEPPCPRSLSPCRSQSGRSSSELPVKLRRED